MLLNVKPFINKPKREDTAQEVGRPDGYTLTEHHGSRDVQMSKGISGCKKVLEKRSGRVVGIEDVRVGDLIFLTWSDASRDVSRLPSNHEVEVHVHAWGVFLGMRGVKRKHLLLAQSKPPMHEIWEADRIPVGLIDHVVVVVPDFLKKYLPKATVQLKKIRLLKAREMWKLVRVRGLD